MRKSGVGYKKTNPQSSHESLFTKNPIKSSSLRAPPLQRRLGKPHFVNSLNLLKNLLIKNQKKLLKII
jgi:hypothetical protein